MTSDLRERARQKNNKDLIERMKRGESLMRYDTLSSWFPPRPVIKKDEAVIRKIYNKEKEKESKSTKHQEKESKKSNKPT